MAISYEIDGWPGYFIDHDGEVSGSKGVISQYKRPDGYRSVKIYKTSPDGYIRKNLLIHRLVAAMFIPNPRECPVVNHKNGIRHDNRVVNLEWMTYSENTQDAHDRNTIGLTMKRCSQYTIEDEFIAVFESIKDASMSTGVSYHGISKSCRGTHVTSGGFKWKFADVQTIGPSVNYDEWTAVDGFPGYRISRIGEIYTEKRKICMKTHVKGGYVCIKLFSDSKPRICRVHRLVAAAYIPNPLNLRVVNHMNGNTLDNSVGNLEWCTATQNSQHAVDTGLTPRPSGKAVIQYDKHDVEIARFPSLKAANEATDASVTNITLVCTGKRITSGGFKWKWG